MTKERIKELLPFLTAYANGVAVQFWCSGTNEWLDVQPGQELTFDLHPKCYRIKPKPRKFWVVEHIKDEDTQLSIFTTRHAAVMFAGPKDLIFSVIENEN